MSKGTLSTANIKGKTYFNSFANDEFPVVEQVSDTKQIGHGDGYVSDGIIPETSEIDELKLMGNTVQNLVPSEPTPTEVFTQYEEAAFVQTSSDTNIKMGSGELKQAIVEGNTYKNLANKLSNPTEVISVEKSVQSIYPNTFTDQYQHILDDAEFASAELEGKTLVNLIDFSKNYSMSYHNDDSNFYTFDKVNNSSITVTQTALNTNWRYIRIYINLSLLKPNTKYLIICDNMANITSARISDGSGENALTEISNIINNKYAILTTNDLSALNNNQILYISISNVTTYPCTISISNMRLIEYKEGMENWDIPYFEGMKSVETIKVTTYNSPVQFGKGGRL